MFAGVRNNAVHAAGIAVNPHKTARQNSAIKKRAQFPFHEPGNDTAAFLLPLQKGLEVAGDYAIKNAFLRTARSIFKIRFPDMETVTFK